MNTPKTFHAGLIWFRRDLRVRDHAALYHALKSCAQVHAVFVFDRDILDPLPRADRRVEFIRESLVELDAQLRQLAGHPGAGLIVLHAVAREAIAHLAQQLGVQAVFTNHDDEPAALARDAAVRGALAQTGIALHTSKDHVIFERDEVLTQAGLPYSVYTPYKNSWRKKLAQPGGRFYFKPYPVARYAAHLAERPAPLARPVPTLAEIGFEPTNLSTLRMEPGESGAQRQFADFLQRISHYANRRDYPAIKGPSYLSVHLRFGTISIRQLVAAVYPLVESGDAGAEIWLNELIWRDFYAQIMAHTPRVVGHSYKSEYDAIRWEHGKTAEAHFTAWCEGRTGYPLVDAAMHQLNQTGYMHNRLRMVTASFLVKDLGIDWRWGERYFAQQLNDFDLASNNGGWQWSSSSGCDAQPYFRIFNPISQSQKFDPEGKFIRRYLPVLQALPTPLLHAPWQASATALLTAGVQLGHNYPHPLVQHDEARERTLQRYAGVIKQPSAK